MQIGNCRFSVSDRCSVIADIRTTFSNILFTYYVFCIIKISIVYAGLRFRLGSVYYYFFRTKSLYCSKTTKKWCVTTRHCAQFNSMNHPPKWVAVILADNVNQFKNRLDNKHWKMHGIVFNYRVDFAETRGLAWVD